MTPFKAPLRVATAAAAALLLAPAAGPASAQPRPAAEIEGCGTVDPGSAEDVFRCMGTMRFRNGTNVFQNNIRTSDCRSIGIRYAAELTKRGVPRAKALEHLPSCEVFAQAAEMLIGKPAYWSDCTGWPGDDPQAHLRDCLTRFVPGYYGARKPEQRAGTCDALRNAHRLALRAAAPDGRMPDGYTPPACDAAAAVIAQWTGGGTPRWQACGGYTPDDAEGHLLRCLGEEPRELLSYRTCIEVRSAYEQKLVEANGALPPSYSILSCGEADAVLSRANAERARIEEERQARIAEAERQRAERAEQQRVAELARRDAEERRHREEQRLAAERRAAEAAAREEAETRRRAEAQAPAAPDLAVTMEATRCDELASHPHDPARVAAGVPDEAVDWEAAAEACLAAFEEHEETPRLWFQLSRVMIAAGAWDDAAALLQAGAEAGHAASMAYLADLSLEGLGGLTADERQAMALYEASAEGGFRPAIEVAAEWRPDLALTIADFSAYERPDIVGDLYRGRFEAWSGDGRYTAVRYLNVVHRDLSEKFMYLDPACPLLVDGRMSKALMQAATQSLGLGRMGESGNTARSVEGSLNLMLEMFTTMAQDPDALMGRAMDWDVLETQASKDAFRLVQEYGCEHPVARHFYDNARRFVMEQEPAPLSEIGGDG